MDIRRNVPNRRFGQRWPAETSNFSFVHHRFDSGLGRCPRGDLDKNLPVRRLYCHKPDTWNMMNGTAVTIDRAVEQLSKYRHDVRILSGGFT
jgi:hypothetical protein